MPLILVVIAGMAHFIEARVVASPATKQQYALVYQLLPSIHVRKVRQRKQKKQEKWKNQQKGEKQQKKEKKQEKEKMAKPPTGMMRTIESNRRRLLAEPLKDIFPSRLKPFNFRLHYPQVCIHVS